MINFLKQKQWGWLAGGIALAISFLLAVTLVKPIGVSTQFVILDGIVWNAVGDDVAVEKEGTKTGYASDNAYLNKSGGKYAKNIANPLNYSFIFVIAMIAGGFVASKFNDGTKDETQAGTVDSSGLPCVWKDKFGNSTKKRYLVTFLGGFFALFGARLAGGCTSGHMMSGMMQTSLSGYLFAMGAFAVAIPVAMFMYRKKGA